MADAEIHSPAKLNLFLAITGRRADGFHDLVSVATPLDWGDTLGVTLRGEGKDFTLSCDDPAVPTDGTNLILRAAEAFRATTGWGRGAHFVLQKRIPMGAGLGGGSSNGAMALRALNRLSGAPLSEPTLETLAAKLGSDCALFLRDGPVVMRGRGERVESLPAAGAARLRGRRVLVFKPGFGIATPWAYGRMVAAAPGSYLSAAQAEARLAAWLGDPAAPAERLLFNNMEVPAFTKFVALPALLDDLRRRFGLEPRMSGSGSACFALLGENAPVAEIEAEIRAKWGASALIVAAKLQ